MSLMLSHTLVSGASEMELQATCIYLQGCRFFVLDQDGIEDENEAPTKDMEDLCWSPIKHNLVLNLLFLIFPTQKTTKLYTRALDN